MENDSQRAEFLPVEWRSNLKLDGGNVISENLQTLTYKIEMYFLCLFLIVPFLAHLNQRLK